jgi:hypothetical protein
MRHRLLLLLLFLPLAGCGGIGASVFNRDHLEYARALSDAQKRQALFNIVRLRYGDVPLFLSTNQVISGYTLGGSAEAGLNLYPGGTGKNLLTALGAVEYSDHPTFTFAPVTGEQFAKSYIRPLSPAQLLPLAQTGMPIDLLLRLGVQRIGSLRNTSPLSGELGKASPDFFPLLADLRALQIQGALSLRTVGEKDGLHVFLVFPEREEESVRRLSTEVRHLLGINARTTEVEVVFGSVPRSSGRLGLVTRSILGMMSEVSARIEVPKQDVQSGRTIPAIPHVLTDPLPVITVRVGPQEPARSYVSLRFGDEWFWIDETDFNSKVAFTILETLRTVAESGTVPQAPVITIPAG